MLGFPSVAKARSNGSTVSFTRAAFNRGVSFTRVISVAISLLSMVPIFGLVGCYRCEPTTPEERMEENCLVQEVLRETSPRNMNAQPKAIPEFKTEPCAPVADEIYRDKPIPELP